MTALSAKGSGGSGVAWKLFGTSFPEEPESISKEGKSSSKYYFSSSLEAVKKGGEIPRKHSMSVELSYQKLKKTFVFDDHLLSSEEQARVISALSDRRWDFRTVDGIRRDTGLPKSSVRQFLQTSSLVRASIVPGSDGCPLYSLKSRGIRKKELLSFLQIMLTKKLK